MTTEQGFLADIIAHPEDDAPRLIYADWLQEQHDAVGSELDAIRVLMAGCSCGRCVRCRNGGQHHNGPCALDRVRPLSAKMRQRALLPLLDYPARAEFIRVQCELAKNTAVAFVDEDDRRLEQGNENPVSSAMCATEAYARAAWLKRRQTALFNADWLPDVGGQLREWYLGHRPPAATIDRPWSFIVCCGFVETVACSLAEWRRHGPALVRSCPLTRVEVKDKRPADVTNESLVSYNYLWFEGNAISEGSPHHLPSDIYRRLARHVFNLPHEAQDALSDACITWAKANPPSPTARPAPAPHP